LRSPDPDGSSGDRTHTPPALLAIRSVGGGFGGLNVARGLADADVDVTLVDRTNHHLFQPLLYQVAAGSWRQA
jgi:NADH:ubiquinone reductase (H+-translocating)